jgi:uncharacterized repeat protein (TIGR03803 family)
MSHLRFALVLTVAVVLSTLVLASSQSSTEKVIYSFKGGHDGSTPYSSLVSDAAGNLYGVTAQGGNSKCFSSGCGTVFELMPHGNGAWGKKILYTFKDGADGGNPVSNLIFDTAGNLYGLAEDGGTVNSGCLYGCGVVFELSPNSNGSWKQTVLYTFQGGTDGSGPAGNLIFDPSGNLYGTTVHGGGNNIICSGGSCGTVFELSPKSDGSWTETVLYSFQGGTDGSTPSSGVTLDSSGNLYGTTLYGGGSENGTVFELKYAGGQWTEALLYSFMGGGNAGNPYGGVVFDAKSNVYGTLIGGGNGGGAVFELKRVGNGWKEFILYFFCTLNNCADGDEPWGTLLADKNGNFYGTTALGGSATCPLGFSWCGTVFEMKHTKYGWKEIVLHQFGNSGDGFSPYSNVVFDAKGNLVGTTIYGGTSSKGTVFEVHPQQ